jgi:hypothetical protein
MTVNAMKPKTNNNFLIVIGLRLEKEISPGKTHIATLPNPSHLHTGICTMPAFVRN